ncbi:MAG: ribosomal-protein-alanine N-acetyltransferase [Syntrophorhabdus sp. PtaU1.Bin058]|nr:MAG: ribosomal-protein-alanine N-acetyltransferase [Syntrophorhabdus sp. PtaU1.Bin058]
MRDTTETCLDNVTIRAMGPADLKDILGIERLSFISPWTRGMFEDTICSPIARNLVLEKDNRIIGYIMLYSVEDEVHIMNIAIDPGHRRKGYGIYLVNYVIEDCSKDGGTEFFLEVREGNRAAQGLYRTLGFSVIGRRKGYYRETGEDAYVMHMSLKK